MVVADFIILGGLILFALIGVFVGFGGGLKFFTSGIFGVAISVVVCYAVGGMLLGATFVTDLLNKISGLWSGEGNFFFDLLTKIHFETIIYYIILFIVAQIVRIILVQILKKFVEIDFIVFKIINKTLGLVLFVGVFAMLVLIVFQVISWVGGSTAENFIGYLSGSALKLDVIFSDNPISKLQDYVQGLM